MTAKTLRQHKRERRNGLKWHEYWIPYIVLFITWLTIHQLIRLFVGMRVSGAEHVREAERLAAERGVGIIFAVNHTNRLFDPFFATAASTPYYASYPMYYVTGGMSMYKAYRKGLGKLIYNDIIFKSLGSQYIKTGAKDYSVSLSKHVQLLNAGHSVCIFPEGALQREGNFADAHGGVGYLALTTDAVIVPVGVADAGDMSPLSFLRRKHKVVIHYGIPMGVENFTYDGNIRERNKYQQFADAVMVRMKRAYARAHVVSQQLQEEYVVTRIMASVRKYLSDKCSRITHIHAVPTIVRGLC